MSGEFIFYCRAGYESDLLAEIDDKLARKNRFGYARFEKDSGFLRYQLAVSGNTQRSQLNIAQQYQSMLSLDALIFARQKVLIMQDLSFDDTQDRVGEIVKALSAQLSTEVKPFGDIRVEYPDTEDGKQIAKFCKKFTVPLRNGLRKAKLLSQAEQKRLPYLHIFFEQGNRCLLAVSFANDRSEAPLGVKRLKFPSQAPSRSTLKLEEAITEFCSKSQQAALFQQGMTAVDLGASPGGWTYQLVNRGMRVEAVDNGAMDDKLMQSGLVDYVAADGFAYKPRDKHVDWLVCDMIEQPNRVASLMIHWLNKKQANAAIFNLKLPMKKRYATLAPIIEQFETELNRDEQPIYMRAKHLYHNRDEVTFMIIKNSQMREEFSL
jgi:23S rRNA (cytidine2498-2'-O)-methyltransferase